MFTEDQVSALLDFEGIVDLTEELKAEFKEKEVQLLDVSAHDFLSLCLLTPSIELALANGNISLLEEMALNQKARKLSKGGYFLQVDPVVHTMKYLISNFEHWKDRFYNFLAVLLEKTAQLYELEILSGPEERINDFEFGRHLLHAPYIFVQFISTFFINDIEQATMNKKISQIEYEKILEIGRRLRIDHYLIFKGFCQTFTVK